MRQVIVLLGLVSLIMVMNSGCASIIEGGEDTVKISSNPDGAAITITDSKGADVFTGTTPTTVSLKKGSGYFKAGDYNVTFVKEGYETKTAEISQGLSGWYIGGNFLIGGFIGWLVVDPLTGAMWTIDDLSVDLISEQANETTGNKMLRIVTIDQVPQNLLTSMVRIR